jgi:hypothetical protein
MPGQLLISKLSARRAPLQDLEGRQGLALQHLQEGAAAGGDVAHLLLDAVLGDGRQRVAAAGDAEGGRLGDGLGDGPGAVGEGANSNTPTGPFQTMVPAA